MDLPIIRQKASYKVELEKGTYFWCACGQSPNDPFCDSTHKNCDLRPVKFEVEEKKVYKLCGCKHSKTQHICDGTHKLL